MTRSGRNHSRPVMSGQPITSFIEPFFALGPVGPVAVPSHGLATVLPHRQGVSDANGTSGNRVGCGCCCC